MERYKKLIIVGIAAAAAVIFIISFVTRQPLRQEDQAGQAVQKSSLPPGPLLDGDLNRVVPVEALGLDTGDVRGLAIRGDEYFEKGQYDQAIEIYTKVLELDPDDVDTYNDLGLAFHYTNRTDRALDVLKTGTGVMPSFQRIWLSLGFVLMSSGNRGEAVSALEKAVELNPETEVGKEAQRMLGLLN